MSHCPWPLCKQLQLWQWWWGWAWWFESSSIDPASLHWQSDSSFLSGKNELCGVNPNQLECTASFSMLPWYDFSGRNMPEPKNLEWELLLSMHQHSHPSSRELLPWEGSAGQAGGSTACSGTMPCSITCSGTMFCSITCCSPRTLVIPANWSCCNNISWNCHVWKTQQREENEFRKLGQHHKEGSARFYGLKRNPSGKQPFAS